MDTSGVFEQNVKLWSRQEPEAAEAVKALKPKNVQFCVAESGAPNLQASKEGEVYFFHDSKDPVKEADMWRKTLELKNTNVLFLFGLGLAYYYDAMESWLRESNQHYLAIIEDDLEVIHRFLESDRARKILEDSQVRIYFISDFKTGAVKFDAVTSEFIGLEFNLSAIRPYLRKRSKDLIHLNSILSFLMKMKQVIHQEYRSFGIPFFRNYYMNLYTLPDSYFAKELWGQFQGVPAIICGAGPSLTKNIDVLKELQDRALIFGGSTSINALNAAGITPHFGVGIDPNPSQLTRIVSNQAYQTPYFVSFRMNSFALNAVHGDHLYVNSRGSYDIFRWFETKLGIDGPGIVEGYNVINFALSIAHKLGCSPIIVVGVDLAYSEGNSYAALTPAHPLYQGTERFQTKSPQEDLLPRKDIHGESVFTLWKWLLESVWFSKFAMEYPEMDLVNATEGGIGFPGVPNKELHEVAEDSLGEKFDFEGMIHAAIQDSVMPEMVNHENILMGLTSLLESMHHCEQLCSDVVDEYKGIVEKISQGKSYPKNLVTEKISSSIGKLDSEVGYQQVLEAFSKHLELVMGREMKKIDLGREWLSKEEILQQHAELFAMRFEFLVDAAKNNSYLIKQAIEVHKGQLQREKGYGDIDQKNFDFMELPPLNEAYSLENGTFTLIDPALGIDFKEPFESDKAEHHRRDYYEDGKLKLEQYFLDGCLQGPSIFYASNGNVVAESWYIHGKKSGRSRFYLSDGKLYSETAYRDGRHHGPQNYYYRSGKIRTHMNFTDGLFDGPLYLFYPNGQLKREIEYQGGMRHGREQMWNFEGKKIGEAHYSNDKPDGDAMFWTASGALVKKVEFSEDGKIIQTSLWDEQGNPLEIDLSEVSKDYFDTVTLKMESFTQNLDQIGSSLNKLLPVIAKRYGGISPEDVQSLQGDIASMKSEIDKLRNINEKMKKESGMDPNNPQEAIWKTPSMQEIFQDMMSKATEELKNSMTHIQSTFITTIEKIASDLKNTKDKKKR